MISNKNVDIICSDSLLQKYIDINENDELNKLSGIDLQDLLFCIKNYYLQLRKSLNFSNKTTFGFELEFEEANHDKICKDIDKINSLKNWILKYDSSLIEGGEINSPILKDTKKTWVQLKKVCEVVDKSAVIGINSGGHIHVGSQILGIKRTSWLNFIKLWSIYENIIFRFSYGDHSGPRATIKNYAEIATKDFWYRYVDAMEKNLSTNDIINSLSLNRYLAVNFVNTFDAGEFFEKNTIEFRCPNGSLDPVIWQNNVNLFVKILDYCNNSNYDDDKIMKRKSINDDKYYDLIYYNEIYLDQALELCDMLFDNNLDKIYFLRQYLKNFQTNTKSKFDEEQIFTKKISK